jgi:hypothetical protein
LAQGSADVSQGTALTGTMDVGATAAGTLTIGLKLTSIFMSIQDLFGKHHTSIVAQAQSTTAGGNGTPIWTNSSGYLVSGNGDNVETLIDYLASQGYTINRDPNNWNNGNPSKSGLHIYDVYNTLKSYGYDDKNFTEGEVSIPLDAIEKLVVKRAVKANLPNEKNKHNYYGLYGAGFVTGGYFSYLASPVSKPFTAANTSKSSSVLSEYCRRTDWGKTNMTVRRYTHTVNGIPRYAYQRGAYVGRLGTRILGPVGVALLVYDATSLMYYYRREISFGLEERQRLIEENQMPPR